MEPNRKQIDHFLKQSLMLVTALCPLIGYEKASEIARYALKHDLTLKDAALKLGYVEVEDFDKFVDSKKMIGKST